MPTKLEREFLKQTAYHEIGHALLYHRYKLGFQYVTVNPTDLSYGHIRPDYDGSDLWFSLVNHYFDRPILPPLMEILKYLLKEHVEICVAGRLCGLYGKYKDKAIAFDELVAFYEDSISEVSHDDVIGWLLLLQEFPDPRNRRKKIKIFAGIDKEMLYNSDEFSEIDADFLESYLALSLFYKQDDKKIMSYYKRAFKKVLNVIESEFDSIDHITKVLLRKKLIRYEQFEEHYNTFSAGQMKK